MAAADPAATATAAAEAADAPRSFVVVAEFCNYEYTWSLHSVSVFADEARCDEKVAELASRLSGSWRITKSANAGPSGTVYFEGNEDSCDMSVLARTSPEVRVVAPRDG